MGFVFNFLLLKISWHVFDVSSQVLDEHIQPGLKLNCTLPVTVI